MTLKFEVEDWNVLKNIFTNIYEIIDEVIIECNDNGLNFTGIDRSHICFFEGAVSKEVFDEYEIDDLLLLYIDLTELIKVLKRGNNKDTLIFEADENEITIKFKNKNVRTFSITQIDGVMDSKKPPNLSYSISFECDFDTIKSSLKDVDLYSDRLTFDCEDDLLVLNGEGGFGKYKNEYHLDNPVDTHCVSTYSVDWLLRIFNTKLSSNNLKISMGQDFPMLIEFSIDNIKMNYLVAPRLAD